MSDELSITIIEEHFWYIIKGKAVIGDNYFCKNYECHKHYMGPFFRVGPKNMEKRINLIKDRIKAEFKIFEQCVE